MLGLSSWASAASGCAALGAFLLVELSRYHRGHAAPLRQGAGVLAGVALLVLLGLALAALAW